MKKPRINISQMIFYCMIAALLIPAMFFSSHTINSELTRYIKQTLDEISAQNVNTIQCEVESDILLLEEISDRVRFDNDITSIASGMKSASDFYGYKRMGVLYRDGSMYVSDNAMLDIFHEDHIVRAFAGESVLSNRLADIADGEPILVYSVPVYDRSGENVIAVLVATLSTDAFDRHLSVSAFNGQGYTYIVQPDGTSVINSNHKSSYRDMTNALTAMELVGDNAQVAAQMKRDMSAGLDGCLLYQNNGKSRYINYEPLGINDWYILSVVPADVMDSSKFKIMTVVYLLFALVAIVSLILVASMIKKEKNKHAELEHILYTDELTGGRSFAKFCIDAAAYFEQRIDRSEKAACIMTDLENFRLINNLYGKAEGNKTILRSYQSFQKALGKRDLLARHSADKLYALLLFKDRDELDRKINDYINELRSANNADENEYILNPSIGVYIADTPGEDIETITNNATIAHDTIIGSGERILYFDEEQRDRLKMNKLLEDQMVLAHQNHEFIPYFQPKYDAETGKICGAEALVRWKNSDGSITMPGRFIPLAESNGFIRVLDRDVFNAVCAFQSKRIENGETCVPISVNVSRQLMYEQNFATDYIETLQKYRLSPELVELEITESVLFDDYSIFRTIINTLRENGFKILMDDFGTGYSSLIMLGSVPIDNLKLDKSFIDSFEEEKGRKIITSVIELAKSLNLPLTAEGVETRGQFDFLKSMGCNVIQGYYFSKPVPEETFTEMLRS